MVALLTSILKITKVSDVLAYKRNNSNMIVSKKTISTI